MGLGRRSLDRVDIEPSFWAGKRILITGHTGFKGSWLSLWLQELGCRVAGYALSPPTRPSMFEVVGIADGMVSVEGDVRDTERLRRLFQEFRPELVFHMAAQSLVRQSYCDPETTFSTNVMGTVHVLEAARAVGETKAVVNITSDKCYANHEWLWGYRETDAMGGRDPYSASKGCAELVTSAFRESFLDSKRYPGHHTVLATARSGNVVGGGDWSPDRLVPDVVRAFSRGEAASIRNPDAVRPWQHVLEPLYGYLMLAQAMYLEGPEFGEAWNFGPNDDDTRTVGWLAHRMGSRWDQEVVHDTGHDSLHEANHLKLDCSKAKSRLGWRPRWNIERALDETLSWYEYYRASEDMRSITLHQIQDYLSS